MTETLSTVENTTGTNVTISFVLGILSGTGDTSSLQSALSSGQLCTGCVSECVMRRLPTRLFSPSAL